MSRIAVAPVIAVLIAALSVAACSRGQPDYGLNAAQLRKDATAAGNESGPITPGSMREFSERVGDTVHFTTDSIGLSQQAQATLTAQARWLNQHTQHSIVIEGHADERGTREYNLALGAQRAANTKHFLVTRGGVAANRIRTVSYGKERPVAVCANISCWSQNRRAVTVLDQGRVAGRY